MTTSKRFMVYMCWDCGLNSWGLFVWATDVSVSSGVLCQADQAALLPHPKNCDTVSQPLTACKGGKALHLKGSSWADRVWIGLSHIFFPLPRQARTSDRPSDPNQCMARMTTSLSTVCTNATWWPWLVAWARWSSILVSASVW